MDWNILALDRGSQKYWLAYWQAASDIIFPIGYIENDGNLSATLADMMIRYTIRTVVVGTPITAAAKKHITTLEDLLGKIDPHLELYRVDEAYTTVQADVTLDAWPDHPGQDTVAAMKLLEFFLQQKSQHSS